MKNAFSALELLIVLGVLCFCCLIFWNKSENPITSAVRERKELKIKQDMINSKLDDIQKIKDTQNIKLKNTMENY